MDIKYNGSKYNIYNGSQYNIYNDSKSQGSQADLTALTSGAECRGRSHTG